jgi:hypothetical protein
MTPKAAKHLKSASFLQNKRKSSSRSVQTLAGYADKEDCYWCPNGIQKKVTRRSKRSTKRLKTEVEPTGKRGKTIRESNKVYFLEKKAKKKILLDCISKTKKIFMTDEKGITVKKCYDEAQIKNIVIKKIMWKVFEEKRNSHIFMSGIEEDGNIFIGAKLSRTSTLEAGWLKTQEHVKALYEAMGAKPNIERGKKRSPITEKYICFGNRAERHSNMISTYAFKKNIKTADKERMDNHVLSLVKILEAKASLLMANAGNVEWHKKLSVDIDIPTMNENGWCTQFCVGQNYCAPMHKDDDYFYTTLSCYTSIDDEQHEILYHFNFPEYEIAIPMRHGDILVFDPRINHCASNPRKENALIVSAYVSKRVVLAKVNEQLQLIQHGCEN